MMKVGLGILGVALVATAADYTWYTLHVRHSIVTGIIHGAVLLPLGELNARAADLSRERPVVAVCRSGARSAQACVILQRSGFSDVANLAGGMLRWRAEGFRVDGGRQ